MTSKEITPERGKLYEFSDSKDFNPSYDLVCVGVTQGGDFICQLINDTSFNVRIMRYCRPIPLSPKDELIKLASDIMGESIWSRAKYYSDRIKQIANRL